MKVLMVYPEYPVTFWSFDHALKFISKKAAYPPLGLLTVAAMLPRDWEVRLIDLNIEKLKDLDLEWADYVMISAMLIQKRSVHSILQRCRSLGKKVVAGGPLYPMSNIMLTYFKIFTLAREKLYITNPYFIPSESILEIGRAHV